MSRETGARGRTVLAALAFAICTGGLGAAPVRAQTAGQSREPPPRVLLVTAHPDDDAAFAGAVYRITHHLKGTVDLALVTDGSGGYRYATLAEPIYGLKLTDEAVAREHLPRIRKQELMAGGAIVGIRDYFFLDEYDHAFTTNADTVLESVWDAEAVRSRLARIMERGDYDFAIGLLPFEAMHGHHKAATILAIEAAAAVSTERRPIVLGGFPCRFGDEPLRFEGLPGHPVTAVTGGEPAGSFDLTAKLGYNDRLDYRIIANWVIAEHKSQGAMQLLVNGAPQECYWSFDANGPEGRERAVRLFESLKADG